MRGGDTGDYVCSWMSDRCSEFYHSTGIFETLRYRCPSSVTFIGSEEPLKATASPRGKPRDARFTHLRFNAQFCPVGLRADSIRPYRGSLNNQPKGATGMRMERVLPGDAEALLEIYAPYVEETAISFEYTVPTVSEFRRRIAEISAKFPYIKAVGTEPSWAMPTRAPSRRGRPMTGTWKPRFMSAGAFAVRVWGGSCTRRWSRA